MFSVKLEFLKIDLTLLKFLLGFIALAQATRLLLEKKIFYAELLVHDALDNNSSRQ